MLNVKCYHHNTTTTKQKHFNCLLRDEIAYHNRNFINVYQLVTKYIADVQAFKKSVFNLISPQTIYNYRLRVRHNACIPEKNFADDVAQMYADE